MSQKIAPGKWSPAERIKTRWYHVLLGMFAVLLGSTGGVFIAVTSEDPSKIALIATGAVGGMGLLMMFPNFVMAVIYRLVTWKTKGADE